MALTKLTSVAESVAEKLTTVYDQKVTGFALLAQAQASANAIVNTFIYAAERTAGYGGASQWKYVPVGSVTVNGYDVVECTTHTELALKYIPDVEGEINFNAIGGIPDAVYTFIPGGNSTYAGGSDNTAVMNWALEQIHFTVIKLSEGYFRFNSQIEFARSSKYIVGTAMLGGFGVTPTSLLCTGGANDDFIIVKDGIFELQEVGLSKLQVYDARTQYGLPATGGRGIYLGASVNKVDYRDMYAHSFPDGGLYLGSDTAARAGDNTVVRNIWTSSSTGPAIVIGQLNNVCRISEVFCDGAGPVIKRDTGDASACSFVFESIKHELGESYSIEMSVNDTVTIDGLQSNIVRSSTSGTFVASVKNVGPNYTLSGINGYDPATATTLNSMEFPSGKLVSSPNYTGQGDIIAPVINYFPNTSGNYSAVKMATRGVNINAGASRVYTVKYVRDLTTRFAAELNVYETGDVEGFAKYAFTGLLTSGGNSINVHEVYRVPTYDLVVTIAAGSVDGEFDITLTNNESFVIVPHLELTGAIRYGYLTEIST